MNDELRDQIVRLAGRILSNPDTNSDDAEELAAALLRHYGAEADLLAVYDQERAIEAQRPGGENDPRLYGVTSGGSRRLHIVKMGDNGFSLDVSLCGVSRNLTIREFPSAEFASRYTVCRKCLDLEAEC